MEAIKGYTVLTNTISSYELVWRTGEGDETMPEVFDTEKDAYKEIASDLISDLQQFMENEREWDEIHWPENEYMIAQIEIAEDGSIVVYQQWDSPEVPGMIIKETIIETTLQEWRDNL